MKNRDSPIVYICSKFRGNITHNMAMARRYSRYAADIGCVPLTPHLWLPQFLSEETERDLAISMDLRLLERCDELWVCGDEISEGMAREIAHADEAGIPVRFITEEVLHVCD
ncbi:MAG: DUF4406 domain-containing protein [Oscillospiraceae bacterium]|nr:DUF4406 domain-containing protein [Oscillospiraceae bacterium]